MPGRPGPFFLALGALACGGESPELPPAPRPDIVLVSIDSLRPDHLGCYGYPRDTSPTIDRLASEGARFLQAVSTTSWTLPAHAALFTGLYDESHGLLRDGLRLSDEHVTLAEVLRGAGYHTAGFFGGPYLHPVFGLDQGFDTWQSSMTRLPDDASEAEVRAEAIAGRETAQADVTGPRLLREFRRWLGGLAERPFFLFLHLWDVHYDYIPPSPFSELFDPDYEGSLSGAGFARNPAIHAGMPRRDLEHLIALYDGEIRFTDDVLAEILGELDARDRLARTLVVVTADHGEEFFEHGGKAHRRTLFDEVVRVPLVLRWPDRIAAGQVIEDQVRLVDVMPTLLSLAGVPRPAETQGRDLSPLLAGRGLPPAAALLSLHRARRDLRALRTSQSKVVLDGKGRSTFFDLARDPREQVPGPEDGRALTARLALAHELEQALAFRGGLGARGATRVSLDREMRERLEALGYLTESREGRAAAEDSAAER
jgi:arylsulfatase A-like enzyme